MGLTFLAAGTSVPDLITSVLVAKEGKVTLMIMLVDRRFESVGLKGGLDDHVGDECEV